MNIFAQTTVEYLSTKINTFDEILTNLRKGGVGIGDSLYQKFQTKKDFYWFIREKLERIEKHKKEIADADTQYDRMQEFADDMKETEEYFYEEEE